MTISSLVLLWLLVRVEDAKTQPSLGYDQPAIGKIEPAKILFSPKAEDLKPAAQLEGAPGLAPEQRLQLVQGPDQSWVLELAGGKGGQRAPIYSLSRDESSRMLPLTILASFPISKPHGLSAVLFEHTLNEGGMRFDQSTTQLTVCVFDHGKPLDPCQVFPVARADVALYRMEDPKYRWQYLGIDLPDGVLEPGRKSDVRLLLKDRDGDSFQDLVLWRRQCRSASLAEVREREAGRPPKGLVECDLDFYLETDEMLVARFDSKARKFEEPRVDKELPRPEEWWWRRLPNLGRLFIR